MLFATYLAGDYERHDESELVDEEVPSEKTPLVKDLQDLPRRRSDGDTPSTQVKSDRPRRRLSMVSVARTASIRGATLTTPMTILPTDSKIFDSPRLARRKSNDDDDYGSLLGSDGDNL